MLEMQDLTTQLSPGKLLEKLISIPSVSSDSDHKNDMEKACEFLANHLKNIGFTVKQIKQAGAHPLLVAYYQVSPKAKTIAIYGHYDVQPEDPEEDWDSPPFTLTEKDDYFVGRGVGDNKGHIAQQISAVHQAIQEQTLKNNLIFLIEGEEETGSKHFAELTAKAKDILDKTDLFIVADAGLHESGAPQFYYGLRGLVYFELIVEVAKHDLHSGVFGGSVYNPAQVLAQLFAHMQNEQGKILIPHFYDDIRTISTEEKEKLAVVQGERTQHDDIFSFSDFDSKYPTLSSKIHPSLDINSFVSGSIGRGAKTIIPKSAKTHFSFRLVEHQDPLKIEALVKSFVAQHIPTNVKYHLKTTGINMPFFTNFNHALVKQVSRVLSAYYKKEVLFNRTGGSIPAAEALLKTFQKPVLVTGFFKDYKIHAPNEYIEKKQFLEGIGAARSIVEQQYK